MKKYLFANLQDNINFRIEINLRLTKKATLINTLIIGCIERNHLIYVRRIVRRLDLCGW